MRSIAWKPGSIRAVQEALGHQDIRTTLRHRRCILTENYERPLDALIRRQRGDGIAGHVRRIRPRHRPITTCLSSRSRYKRLTCLSRYQRQLGH